MEEPRGPVTYAFGCFHVYAHKLRRLLSPQKADALLMRLRCICLHVREKTPLGGGLAVGGYKGKHLSHSRLKLTIYHGLNLECIIVGRNVVNFKLRCYNELWAAKHL